MGHTRLGEVPKTHKWNELVERISGSGRTGTVATAGVSVGVIAAQTLDATQQSLKRAATDPGVRYTFYLIAQVALAARASNWEGALGAHGILLSKDSTVFDFTVEMQNAIDRYVGTSRSGSTDLSEIAQQSAGEAIASLAGSRTVNLFGGSSDDVRNAIRSLSSKKGFGDLGQRFFGRFVARFLNFYLSRVTAASLGSPRLRDLGDVAQFNDALRIHCDQSALIVRDFCGEWFSKTVYREGIDLKNTSKFLAIAFRKLRSELGRQGHEL
jgi:hypothetical protein